ncbi:MAG: MFS transporter [Oscillospiraceae bacterium]|nr:MFS transporter [Oscillospiraceae bacterium]
MSKRDPSSGTGIFSNRNFLLVFFGALASELGGMLYSFAVSFYILDISGNSAFLQGLFLALCGIAMLLFTPLGGVLGDRFRKSGIMAACDFIKGAIIIAATALMLIFRGSRAELVILFINGILGNAVSGVFSPVASSILPHIVEEDRLQQANSWLTIKNSLESILGTVLAGILYSAMPVHTLFFLVGICFIISGISETFLRIHEQVRDEPLTLRSVFSDMKDGFLYLKSNRAMLALLVAVLFINFFFSPLTANFLPFFVRTDLAGAQSYLLDDVLTPELWSSVFGMCIGITSLLGAAVLSAAKQSEKCGRKISFLLCSLAAINIVLTACYIIFVGRGGPINVFLIAFTLGCLAIGYIVSGINIPVSTAVMRLVDRSMLSKVNSITSIGSQGMVPLSSVLSGAVMERYGASSLLVFCSIGFALTAAFTVLSRDIQEL